MLFLNSRKSIVFLVIVLMGTVLLSGFEYRNKSDQKKMIRNYKLSEKQFKKAVNNFSRGNVAEAERHMKKCVEIFPMHANGHYYLSLIYYKEKKFPPALTHVEKAKATIQQLKQFKAEVLLTRSLKLKEYQKDLKDGKYASYFGENNPCLVRNGTHTSERKASEVELLLGKTEKTEIAVPANYFYSHGNILYKLKRYKESIQQYVEVIRRDPDHGGAYNNLANLFYLAGKKDAASLCLNQAEACGFKVDPRFKKILE